MREHDKKSIPIEFKTFIPPVFLPDSTSIPYDLENEPWLRQQMTQKIESNRQQFGTVEKFVEAFQNELTNFRNQAEQAVRTYEMRRRQMEFIRNWYDANAVKPVKGLD